MPLAHGREQLLRSRSERRESQFAGGGKKGNKNRFCLSDRAVLLSANAKEGRSLWRQVKPLLQLSIALVGRKRRRPCERTRRGLARWKPVSPPRPAAPQPGAGSEALRSLRYEHDWPNIGWLRTQVLMRNNKPGYWAIIKYKELLNPCIVHILKEINHFELRRIQFIRREEIANTQ